ncbi:unnamed protein product [Staurois parvus]|uniref:Uncharacterized protein n=1 Tax=Staurois parvus TaxID=386267 RepID=A0ABN9BWT3_9NEOB|nr:unnamed protein product [Staurois parvus]
MGPPGNRGFMGPLCPCPNSKKPMKKVPGHLMGPPIDPGPSASARVSKWSVRPCSFSVSVDERCYVNYKCS